LKDGKSKKDPLVEGVMLVLKQFIGLLEKEGFQMISGEGKPFNPHHQEAIGHIEAKGQKEGTVVQVHRKGFMLHDRVVRPALVTIAKAPAESDHADDQEETLLN
jgi:molecular chaperone GrpE